MNQYKYVQLNGQIIYFGPKASSAVMPPSKGTEIFVGNLPPNMFLDELVPLFSQKGEIYNIRLMVDFNGRNRGYCFVAYFRAEDAHAAAAALNHYQLRPTTKIAVSISVDNRRLFVGNIPKELSRSELWLHFQNYDVEGVKDIIMYRDPFNERKNRGFVFVEFDSHRLAAKARRQLAPGNLVIDNQQLFVDWAEPLPTVSPHVMRQVTKLYLSNLPPELSTEDLKNILFGVLDPVHVLKVHKMKNFAFVHFTIRRCAEEAFRKLQGFRIDNKAMSVEWARPIEFSKSRRCGQPVDNFCKSVPPFMKRNGSVGKESSGKGSQSAANSPSTSVWNDVSAWQNSEYFSILNNLN